MASNDLSLVSFENQLQNYRRILVPLYQSHPNFRALPNLEILEKFEQFLDKHGRFSFDRENSEGHFTGSCFLLHETRREVLLLKHKKLNKWLQLGGHPENEYNPYKTAVREASEESGFKELSALSLNMIQAEILPFDLDLHFIPANKKEKEHWHFDVRFLAKAKGIAAESEEGAVLSWFEWEKISELEATDESVFKQAQKVLLFEEMGWLS